LKDASITSEDYDCLAKTCHTQLFVSSNGFIWLGKKARSPSMIREFCFSKSFGLTFWAYHTLWHKVAIVQIFFFILLFTLIFGNATRLNIIC